MEAAIVAGKVLVNGRRATVGQRVGPSDRLSFDGRPVALKIERRLPRVLVYHKPPGELVTARDPQGRPTVFDRLPRIRGGSWIAVGRLDFNTGGLLLLTDSGELANRMMHPSSEMEREYAVRIRGQLSRDQLERLVRGVVLDDGPARFDSIESGGGTGSNRWYRVVLREGRNREVRRMFEALGMTVSRLLRVRFGPVALPSSLRRGQWRELPQRDVSPLLESLESGGKHGAATSQN